MKSPNMLSHKKYPVLFNCISTVLKQVCYNVEEETNPDNTNGLEAQTHTLHSSKELSSTSSVVNLNNKCNNR